MWLVWRMFTFIPLTQKRHPSATVLAGKGWPPMSHHCSYLCKKDFGRRGISDLSNLSKFKSAQFSRGSMEIWKLSVLPWCKIIPQSAWVESWGWQFSLDDPLTKQGHSWMNPGSSDLFFGHLAVHIFLRWQGSGRVDLRATDQGSVHWWPVRTNAPKTGLPKLHRTRSLVHPKKYENHRQMRPLIFHCRGYWRS